MNVVRNIEQMSVSLDMNAPIFALPQRSSTRVPLIEIFRIPAVKLFYEKRYTLFYGRREQHMVVVGHKAVGMNMHEGIPNMFGMSPGLCVIRDRVCVVESEEIVDKTQPVAVV